MAITEFTVGYYDHIEGRVLYIPFRELSFSEDDHFSFQFIDANGESHNVPYYRVREVFRNGELIWRCKQYFHLEQVSSVDGKEPPPSI